MSFCTFGNQSPNRCWFVPELAGSVLLLLTMIVALVDTNSSFRENRAKKIEAAQIFTKT
jgi:hypothetical protein